MAFRTKKISQMDPKGSNLASTDLLEISQLVSGSYVTKSITGAEIVASVPPTSVDWGDIGGTLSAQTDLNTALSGKQATVTLTTTGTGAATFVSNVLNVPTPAAATFSSLTTTGSSGASTLTSGVLNVPTYSLSGLGGVPTTRTLTINGTTQDLSADRTFTISTGITIGTTAITSGTVGRVLFEGSGNVVQQSSSLFWDSTNNRLGIGTATPTQTLDVNGQSVFRDALTISNGGDRGALSWGGGTFYIQSLGTQDMSLVIPSGAKPFIIKAITGNVLINTTTDSGYKLDINGTARVSATDGATAFQITAPTRAWYFTTSQAGGTFNAISGSANGGSGTGNFGYVLGGGWAFHIGTTTSQGNSLLGVYTSGANAGDIRIGGQTSVASSILTIDSTTKGFLPPRMTTTQKNAIASPATGLMVYDTTLNLMALYNGTTWTTL